MKSNGPRVAPHWDSVWKILFLFKTLSEKSPHNRHQLRAEGVVNTLVQFLHHVVSFMNGGGVRSNRKNCPEDVAEICMNVLYNMAKDCDDTDTAVVVETLAKFMG